MVKTVLLSIGCVAGIVCFGVGMLIYNAGDNSDANALAHLAGLPVLALGGLIAVLCALGLLL